MHTQTPAHHTIIACTPTAFHLPSPFMRRSAYGGRLVGQDSLGEMKLFTRTHRQSPIATALSRKGAPPETPALSPPPNTHLSFKLSCAQSRTVFPQSTSRHKTHRQGKHNNQAFGCGLFPPTLLFCISFSDQDQLTCHSFHVPSVVQSLSCPAFLLFVACLYTHPFGNDTSSSRHERINFTRLHHPFESWKSPTQLRLRIFILPPWDCFPQHYRRLPLRPPRNALFRKQRHIMCPSQLPPFPSTAKSLGLMTSTTSRRLTAGRNLAPRRFTPLNYTVANVIRDRIRGKKTRSKSGLRMSRMHSWRQFARSPSSAVAKLSSTRNLAVGMS